VRGRKRGGVHLLRFGYIWFGGVLTSHSDKIWSYFVLVLLFFHYQLEHNMGALERRNPVCVGFTVQLLFDILLGINNIDFTIHCFFLI
jgi:hypothetical protein